MPNNRFNCWNDYLIKFPYNHPYNKPNLDKLNVVFSNNNIITSPKLIIPLINLKTSIVGQTPKILTAKKSVASFRLRKNSPTGLYTTLRKDKAQAFLLLLNIYFLPKYLTLNPKLFQSSLKLVNKKISINNVTVLSFGLNSISLLTHLMPLNINIDKDNNLIQLIQNTGGYIQIHIKTTPNKITTLANDKQSIQLIQNIADKFYLSSLYIPVNV